MAVPTALAGQIQPDSVLLRGRVVEEQGGEPIVGVDLTILDRLGRIIGRAETNSRGQFTFVARDKAGVTIRVKRLGYQDNETPFLWFDRFDFYDLEIRMDRRAILLAPLEVMARRATTSPVLERFQRRSESGLGWYVTPEEIEARGASRVTDLLAEVPGVRLASSGAGLRRVVQMRGGARPTLCPVQVYLDGVRLNADGGGWEAQLVAIDEYVSPGSVHGIEIYRGLSTVPPEFLNENAKCGVVAVWTRRGISN